MLITDLPCEIIIEIIKFSFTGFELLPNFSLVCKEWHNLINSEEFYEYIYNSLFSWRNNTHKTDQKIINYESLLKNELKFWNSWNFYEQLDEFITSKIINDKCQHLLQIKRLKTVDKRNIITQPIFYNTGAYYFEIKCLQWREKGDNIFAGFIFQSSNKNFNNINFNTYLGSGGNKGSFGLYFPNGCIYGVIAKNSSYISMSYACQRINVNTKVGIYFDTNNLLVRFVLVKEEQYFPMVPFDKFLNEEKGIGVLSCN